MSAKNLSFIGVYIFSYNSLDSPEEPSVIQSSTPRRLLDIELRCKDGLVMAPSQYLAMNSVVFEKMLFSNVQMLESITSVILLEDVLIADMQLLLKFCQVQPNYQRLVNELSKESTLSAISVAHRFEFTYALTMLCDRLVEVILRPTPAELQFVDMLGLQTVLQKWSQLSASPRYQLKFLAGLADFPLSAKTVQLFAQAKYQAHLSSLLPKCNFKSRITIYI